MSRVREVRLEAYSDQAYLWHYTRPAAERGGAGMRITASPSGMSVIALLAALLLTWSAWADGPPAPKDLVKAELLAEKPCGNFQSIAVGRPESPGFRQ